MVSVVRESWAQRIAAARIVEEQSPLDYHGMHPRRYAIHDPSAGPSTHPYFDGAPDTIAFLDWSDEGDSVYIHFMATRDDQKRKGLARKLVEHLYAASDKDVNWGRIISDEAQELWESIKDKHPDRWNKAKLW